MKIIIVLSALCALVLGDFNSNVHKKELFTGNQIVTKVGPYSLDFYSVREYFVDDVLLTTIDRSLVTQIIEDALESFRDVVINGNDDLPPLDPLVVDRIGPFAYSDTGIRVSGSIDNLRAEGLRWYIVDSVNFNALRLSLGAHLILPWLSVSGSYDVNARLALLLTHRAGGNFRIFLNRFEFGVDLRMGTNLLNGHLVLRELDIKIDIHDTMIQIDGMTGSSLINNFISSYINNLTQDIVQNNMNTVSRLLSEALHDAVNDILKEFTLGDLIGN